MRHNSIVRKLRVRFPSALWTLATVLLSLGLITACASPPSKTKPASFSLTIAVLDKLGADPSDPLPADIAALCRPFEAGSCPEVAFVPEAQLLRIDRRPPAELSLKRESSWQTRLQNFYRARSIELITRSLQKTIAETRLGAAFSEPGATAKERLEYLSGFLSGVNGGQVLVYQKKRHGQALPAGLGQWQTFDKLDSLRLEVSNLLCEAYRLGSLPSVVILYDPDVGLAPPTRRTSDPSPKKSASNLAFERFRRWQDFADRTPEETDAYLRRLEAQYPQDYRFTLERVRAAIYGSTHREAFELLEVAAEKAIRNGQADTMLAVLEGQKDDRIRGFWKLAHGHEQEWNPIVASLRRNRFTPPEETEHLTHKR